MVTDVCDNMAEVVEARLGDCIAEMDGRGVFVPDVEQEVSPLRFLRGRRWTRLRGVLGDSAMVFDGA